MSGTRSHSPRAPVTEPRAALIVAHGSPSAPQGPEAAMRRLAAAVSHSLPGWKVRGATLAGKGTLEAALDEVREGRLLVYPFFMADGWFVRKVLPKRIRALRGSGFTVAPPLGLDPSLPAFCTSYLKKAAARTGSRPEETAVLLAAHGSPSDPRPRAAVETLARAITRTGAFRAIRLGFIDERPSLAEAARVQGPALCLPFFAGRASHVERDLPEALASASFGGLMLDPIGALPDIQETVARSLAQSRSAVSQRRTTAVF